MLAVEFEEWGLNAPSLPQPIASASAFLLLFFLLRSFVRNQTRPQMLQTLIDVHFRFE